VTSLRLSDTPAKPLVLATLLLALVAGCGGGSRDVPCTGNGDCRLGQGGVCLPDPGSSRSYCAYSDDACPSDLRWSDFEVPASISGQCVPEDALIDGGLVDAQLPDAALDAQPPDAALDAQPPDAALDAQPPDAALDAPGPRTIGPFEASGLLFAARMDHASVIAEGRLHVIGGVTCATCTQVDRDANRTTKSTESAPLTATDLGTFTPGPTLTYARAGAAVFHVKRGSGNWVYVLGGHKRDSPASSGDYIQQIERAAVATDGTLGPFSEVPQLLDIGRAHARVVVSGDHVYIVGGASAHQTFTSSIAHATLSANGDLVSSFTPYSSSTLAVARGRFAAIVTPDRAVIVGGQVAGATADSSDAVESGALNGSGVLGAMTSAATLPTARTAPVGLELDGTLWLFGGGRHGVDATDQILTAPATLDAPFTVSPVTLPAPRSAATGALLPDRFCLVGGSSDTSDANVLDTVICGPLQ
jgi:hypothetical protein